MKPNPDAFTTEVLWQLALVRAEIAEVKALTAEIIEKQTGKPHSKIQKRYAEKKKVFAEKLYQKAIKAVGLPEDSNPDHDGESDFFPT